MGLFSDAMERDKKAKEEKIIQKGIEIYMKKYNLSFDEAKDKYFEDKNKIRSMLGIDKREEKRSAIKNRIEENKAAGIASCPKCGGVSLIPKKGFGFGKYYLTCASCGHTFKAGKQ